MKILTEKLLFAKQSAESANQIKSRFLANMSHEIRTPLGVIIGFTDLLREQLDDKRDVGDYIERISNNAQQLGSLIDEILDLSKIEADRLEAERNVVDLPLLLDDVFTGMAMIAREKSLNFEHSWTSNPAGYVITDHTRLRQIIINVIGNAIKFTDCGSVVVTLCVTKKVVGRNLEVRVRDTGIGLSREQQDRIFEPFMQADSSVTRRFGGTGLGLALSKRLAKVLGGDLMLEDSVPNQGSTFAITIDIGEEIGAPVQMIRSEPQERTSYARLPRLPSGYSYRCLKAGFTAYLSKPVDRRSLLQLISDHTMNIPEKK